MTHSEIRIGDITFDTLSTQLMAEFWAAVLGFESQVVTAEFASIIDPAGRGPRCCFQKVDTPKLGKNRVHLDLHTCDMEGEVARIVALGATLVARREDEGVVWTVMLDIEGNEFCVQPPPPGSQ
ncbi:VOC family protein [bacterium]|nr:MAG: VOC family protein [bacterium]